MARKKKSKEEKSIPAAEIPRRKFFVNGVLQFDFYAREEKKDRTHDKIIAAFFEDKDWKYLKNYCDWTLKSVESNKELTEFYITVTEKKEKKDE